MAVCAQEFHQRAFEARFIKELKRRLNYFRMNQLRVDAEYLAILKLEPNSSPSKSLIKFCDSIVSGLCYTSALLINGIQLPCTSVDVHEARFNDI